MAKIKTKVLIFLLFAVAIVSISGCTKAECNVSSDCSSRACSIAKCDAKKCTYSPQVNCCGNNVKEPIENGKPGNQCTCPQDYGKCEGIPKVKIGSRTEDASYLHYFCSETSECVLGVEDKDISTQNFLDTISNLFFKASSVASYSKPFEIGKDKFELRISLDDANKDLVLPVKITKVKILYSGTSSRIEQLISEVDLDESLDVIGDEVLIGIPLTLNYKPQELEETGIMRYSIDYAYTKQVIAGKDSNGNTVYNEQESRSTFTSQTKPLLLVRTE